MSSGVGARGRCRRAVLLRGVGLPTAGEVKSVGHGGAVLALPVTFPVKTMPSFDALSVDLQWETVPPPLLELTLSLGVCGAAASEACLRLSVVLEEVLAGPMSVGTLFPGEMDGPVGS